MCEPFPGCSLILTDGCSLCLCFSVRLSCRCHDGNSETDPGPSTCLGSSSPVWMPHQSSSDPGAAVCLRDTHLKVTDRCSGGQLKKVTHSAAESCRAKSSRSKSGTLSLRLTVISWGLQVTWRDKGRTVTRVQVGIYKVWMNLGYSFWVISPLIYFCWLWVLLPFWHGLNASPHQILMLKS